MIVFQVAEITTLFFMKYFYFENFLPMYFIYIYSLLQPPPNLPVPVFCHFVFVVPPHARELGPVEYRQPPTGTAPKKSHSPSSSS